MLSTQTLLRRSLAKAVVQPRYFSATAAADLQRSCNLLLRSAKDDKPETKEKQQNIASEFIDAVLYGSKKAKEEENQTHSKMLARGKYVHELQSKPVASKKKSLF